MLDRSEICVKEICHTAVNIYKLCLEEMGYDLGVTNNKIDYHNYLYDNNIHLMSNEFVYDKDQPFVQLSEEDLKFLKDLNIQEGGEGLEHSGRFTSKDTFVKTIFNAFVNKGINNIVAACMTAQAALESNWGTSHYAMFSNYGGINYHKGADYKIPGKSAHGHTKAGYKNVGRYIEEKLGIMKRLYPGAIDSNTPEKYLNIIQGNNPNKYCYGGENEAQRRQYGNLVMNVMKSVKKYLA